MSIKFNILLSSRSNHAMFLGLFPERKWCASFEERVRERKFSPFAPIIIAIFVRINFEFSWLKGQKTGWTRKAMIRRFEFGIACRGNGTRFWHAWRATVLRKEHFEKSPTSALPVWFASFSAEALTTHNSFVQCYWAIRTPDADRSGNASTHAKNEITR